MFIISEISSTRSCRLPARLPLVSTDSFCLVCWPLRVQILLNFASFLIFKVNSIVNELGILVLAFLLLSMKSGLLDSSSALRDPCSAFSPSVSTGSALSHAPRSHLFSYFF